MSAIDKLIGQEQAKRVAARHAWDIRENSDKIASNPSFLGATSSGKTQFARAFASDCGIPLLELQPQAIRTVNALMDAIQEFEIPNELLADYRSGGKPPRIAIFIDEIHQASKAIEQGLLKALEPKDRMLVSEDGRKMDTTNFVFMFATTDRGDLFDALDTRTVKIQLRLYSQAEVADIVQLNYPNWNRKACELIAKYNPTIPREALCFAEEMRIEAERTGCRDAIKIAKQIAHDHRIDEFGMTEQRLAVLTALGHQPISKSRICNVAGVKEAELVKFTMPPMLASLPDREMPLVTVSGKGYTITPEGLKELDKRSIYNRGIEAIPKSVRGLYAVEERSPNIVSMRGFVEQA